MKIATSLCIVLLAGALLVQPAVAKPSIAGIKAGIQNAKIQVQGRIGFATWLAGNKEVRAAYHAETKAAGLRKIRLAAGIFSGLSVLNLASALKGNLFGATFGTITALWAGGELVNASKAKATARFNTISQALESGKTIPKSVLRMYMKDSVGRLAKAEGALTEARKNLAAAQAALPQREQAIPYLQARQQQAAAALDR